MEQTKLQFRADTGEYTPEELKGSDTCLCPLNKSTFEVGTKTVTVTLYKTTSKSNGKLQYLLNHMTINQTSREHYYLFGTLSSLYKDISELLQSIESAKFWKILYTDLFKHTSVQFPELPTVDSYSLEHMKPLKDVLSINLYNYIDEIYPHNETINPIFSNTRVYTHPTISISNSLHAEFAQNIAIRKLMYSDINTIFWFNTMLSKNDTSIKLTSTDQIKRTLKNYNEVHVKKDGVSYTRSNIKRYVESVLSVSQEVCFVFNRYMLDVLSETTIETVKNSDAHIIISTEVGQNYIGGYTVELTDVSNMESKEDICTVHADSPLNSHFTLKYKKDVVVESDKLQFKPFEIFPIKLSKKYSYEVLPNFYSKP